MNTFQPNRGHSVPSFSASVLSPRLLHRRRYHHAATIPKISSSLEDELLKRYRDRILSTQKAAFNKVTIVLTQHVY